MADLTLVIDTTYVDKAIRKTVAFEGQIRKLVKKFENGAVSAEDYNKGLLQIKRAYEELGVSSQRATAQVRKFARDLQKEKEAILQSKALEKERKELERLKTTYNESYKAAKIFKSTLRDLDIAYKKGAISTDQYKAKVAALKDEYREFLRGNASNLNRFSQAVSGSTRGVNRFGLITQQTGYQVGDFIVQVQSGTNAFVAFGQQATQIAGTLTLLGGSWVAIGSALGVAIPLATALLGAMMRTKRQAKEADEKFKSISSTLSEIESYNFSNIKDGLLEIAKSVSKEFQTTLDIVKEVSQQDLNKSVGKTASSFDKQLQEFREKLKNFKAESKGSTLSPYGSLYMMFRSAPEFNYLGFTDPEQAQKALDTLSKLQGKSREELARSLEIVSKTLSEQGLLTDELKARLAELAKEVDVQKIIIDQAEDLKSKEELRKKVAQSLVETFKRGVEVFKENLRQYEEAQKAGEEILKQQNRLNRLRVLEITYGKESAEYVKQKQAYELEDLNARIEELGVSEELANEMRRALKFQQDMELADATGTIDSMVTSAKNLAEQFGIAYDKAFMLSEIQFDNMPTTSFGSGFGTLNPGLTPGLKLRWGRDPKGNEVKPPKIETKKSGGAGRQVDEFEALRRQLDKNYEAAKKYAEGEKLLNEALEKNRITSTEYKDLLQKLKDRYTILSDEVKRFQDTQQQVADSLKNNFTSAFEAITQSGDDLAANLKRITLQMINDLFRVMFVQRLVGSYDATTGKGSGLVGMLMPSLTGLIPSEKGNVFLGGDVMAFANGGIVDNTTLFPMRGGKVGMMGEAGPEAIMPLARGPDGKLGVRSNSNQPINVTFNINTPDVEGFKKSRTQIAAMLQQTLASGRRNM